MWKNRLFLAFIQLLLLCVDARADSFLQVMAERSSRTLLTANRLYHVDCSAGSDDNSGAADAPWRTPTHAYDYARNNLDLAGQYHVTVRLLSNCKGQNVMAGPLVGQLTPQDFTFVGDCANPGAISVSANGKQQYLWYAAEDARFAVRCMTVESSDGGAGFLVTNGVLMAGDVWLHGVDANAWVDVAGPRSLFHAIGPLTFLHGGSTNIGFVAEDHGHIILPGALVCSGAPIYGTFVQADLGGMIDATSATVTHAACTGRKYNALTLGIVFTGGTHDLGFFPGTSAGVVSGGHYE
jgi:hypothetical protein